MNIVEPFQRMARQQPARPAIMVGGKVTTYGELLTLAGGLAAALEADGVHAGQRVAFIGPPLVRVASTLALGWIGAASAETASLPDGKLGELAELLELDAIYAPRDIDLGGANARSRRIEPLLDRIGSATAPPLWDGDPAALWRIVVSSGTTGRPKGIACSHTSITNVHLLRTVYPSGPGDVVVIAMKAGMTLAVHNWLRCLYSGACALLAENLPLEELHKLLQGDVPTHCMVTPAVANSLAAECANADAPNPHPGKRLHTLTTGGGGVSAGVRETLRKHFCANVLAHYGAAEMQIVAVLDPQLSDARPKCTGRLLPWIEAQAVGTAGEVLPPGEVGQLRFRSPALATGYLGHVDDQAFKDGWFYSQDRGAVLLDGLLFLHGRTNDVINLNGNKFDPEIMEAAIQEDRNILECAVVDVPGAGGVELVAVIVEPAGITDPGSLLERCRKAVPGAWPHRILRTDKLPRNENGKLMRDVIRRSVVNGMEEGGNAS